MIKTHASSRFVLRTLEEIRDALDIVVQVERTESTFTESKKSVYLCEVVRLCDYSRTDTADKLSEELSKTLAENRTLRRKVDRLEKTLQKERAFYDD